MRNLRFIHLLWVAISLPVMGWAGSWSCDVGPRVERTWELYWENGAEVECSLANVFGGHLGLGASVTSTRIGSAWNPNALRQEQYLVNSAWNFRLQKRVRPYVNLSAGWFWLDVGPAIFDVIPHSSPLLVLGSGARVGIWGPISWNAGFGYHLITGDGKSGPGSIYPLFLHTSVQWRIPG